MKGIWTAKDLLELAKVPDGSYKLMADVNMQGYTWKPVDFASTLEMSCGKTFVFNG